MSPTTVRLLWVLALLSGGCTPRTPPAAPAPEAPAVGAADSTTRPMLRSVPLPLSYEGATERDTRSPIGSPGPDYWQQRVRYQIEAELDPESQTLRGMERVWYVNNSPDTLTDLVLNLYQNVFSEGVPRNRFSPITGGITIERLATQGRELEPLDPAQLRPSAPGTQPPAGYVVQGTLGRIVLPRPLPPGDSLELEAEWQFQVPPAGAYRTAWEEALGGRAFQVAQWYPQIAVYDDIDGWDATPYLGDGEFYLEYGDFDVSITLPDGFLVGATGLLQNPEEVLTEEAQQRLAEALESDSITRIVTEADLTAENATQRSPEGQLTWRFRAEDVRDFAFATSDRYVLDATRAILADDTGGERVVPVYAFYRPGAPNWERAALFARHATDFFSELLIPYLYPQITVAEGSVGGMEYPQIVFIGKPQAEEALQSVIAHEVAHEWFPMMVGQNEAEYAWMDEGSASFLDALARGDFYSDPDPFAGDLERYLGVAGLESEVPLMRHTDLVTPYGARTVAAYTKPGVLLRSLRALLGEDVFREAMRTYAREWLLKHPTPWDFFNTIERVSGRELDWFFYPWWFETGTLDQAIDAVEGAETGTARVTIRDGGEIPVPGIVVATTAAGDTVMAEIPIETWLGGVRVAEVTLEAPGPIVRVEVDPEQIFPDVDRENNVWIAPGP